MADPKKPSSFVPDEQPVGSFVPDEPSVDAAAPDEPALSGLEAAIGGGLQGALLGNVDELAGLIGGPAARQRALAYLAAAKRQHPTTTSLSEGAGGVASTTAATLLGGIPGLVAASGLQGAGGAPSGEKTSGAATGAALGAAFGGAGKAVKGIANLFPKIASSLGFITHEGAKALVATAGAALGSTFGPAGAGVGALLGSSAARKAVIGKAVQAGAEEGWQGVALPGAKAAISGPGTQYVGGLYGAVKTAAQNVPKVAGSAQAKTVGATIGSMGTSAGNAVSNTLVSSEAQDRGPEAGGAMHSRLMAQNAAYRRRELAKMNKRGQDE